MPAEILSIDLTNCATEGIYLNAAESPEVFSLGDECRLFKDDK
jgi:hypothetical protein